MQPQTQIYRTPIYSLKLVRESHVKTEERPQLSSPDTVVALARAYIGDSPYEHAIMLMLDVKNRLIGIHNIGTGSVDRCAVYPQNVFKMALLANAASVLFIHNHPSGEPEPSQDDKRLTRTLVEGARTLELRVVDHIIIGDGTDKYFSFVENSLLG